jgi:calcineurin-like phosphoesterase
VIEKFRTLLPVRFEVAKGLVQFNAVIVDIDENTGRAAEIMRISDVSGICGK